LFRPVARHGGFVSDIVGDAMLALWPDRSPDTRKHMLSALVEMQEAARQFNEQAPTHHLATRFGVEWGRVTLTMVGSQTHYEYRAVGDAVNTATRIQELNKKLGTRVLVSSSASSTVTGTYLMRDVGTFLLRGRRAPVQLSELIGFREIATREQLELCRMFETGINFVRSGKVAEALIAFRGTLAQFPGDQATAFYVQRLESGINLTNGALKAD
jgi:adenylate cyclase